MPSYTIVSRQSGYRVEVIADDGSHHIMLGFDTEMEAQAWVEADRKIEMARMAARETE